MPGTRHPSRFGMTPPPKRGGNLGQYEEQLAQWFLEGTFFRDFVHRNPRGKGGKGELADAVVLFEDAALVVQVKACFSARDPRSWAASAIADAFRQLQGSLRMLTEGHVKELHSETLGPVRFDPDRYPNRIGLIVLAHGGSPYRVEDAAPGVKQASCPPHILSLRDFLRISHRFDTAGDFIGYLDFRSELMGEIKPVVHKELDTLAQIAGRVQSVLSRQAPNQEPETIERTVRSFQRMASGAERRSTDWKYGLLFDDIIATLHDRDPSLGWNDDTTIKDQRFAIELLSAVTRQRRIALGKRLLNLRVNALDGDDHYFATYRRPLSTAYVFLATKAPRDQRYRFLQVIASAAQATYDAEKVVGVAMEAMESGVSYDVFVRVGALPMEFRQRIMEMGLLSGPGTRQLVP